MSFPHPQYKQGSIMLRSGAADSDSSHLPRRQFLTQVAALAGSAIFPWSALAPQERPAPPASKGWIDVHHHFAPTAYTEILKDKRNFPAAMVGWSVQKAIDDMDQGGVTASMNSIVVPGVWFGDAEQAHHLARDSNEYAAKLASDYPGRFGSFATLTLPNIDGSLQEMEYALDTLHADGLQLFTSYGNKWLGDPFFAPLFEELNRRKAVVFVHPTLNDCCKNLLSGVATAAIEYGADTTRAIARMVYSGASKRYPDIRMIFSHAGGTMPFLIGRFADRVPPKGANPANWRTDFQAEVGKFYYDTAQAYHPVPMTALRHVVPMSQIVFGTDYPYRSSLENTKGLMEGGVFDPEELRAIKNENVLNLLPRLKTFGQSAPASN
jgi:6-methylsalicylate decarboxylase